jgi:hypothetical protein
MSHTANVWQSLPVVSDKLTSHDAFQFACEGCGTVIRMQSDPPGSTNLLPMGGVVVL